MSRKSHSIPSQRLTLSVSASLSRGPAAKPQRSWWWLVGIVVVGWALLAYPTALLALLSYLLMTDSTGTGVSTSSVVVGVLGLLVVLCMVAAPVLTGLAVVWRKNIWRILAASMWAVTIAAVIYLLVEWMLPIG